MCSLIEPTEINIDGDSIDLEMRVTEGPSGLSEPCTYQW